MTPDQKEAFRREVLEEAAIHLEGNRSVFMRDAAAVLRALAASQPATLDADLVDILDEISAATPQHNRARGISQPAPAADTGQAVAWQWRILPKCNGGYYSDWVVTEKLPAVDNCLEVQPLYAHPAPLDAERVREDERDRLLAAAYLHDSRKSLNASDWLREQGAMLPANRAALRQKEGEA